MDQIITTKEQAQALQTIRKCNDIETPEQLANVISDKRVQRYCELPDTERAQWLLGQIQMLTYITQKKAEDEADLAILTAMVDRAVMADQRMKWLTPIEITDALLKGAAKEFGEFFGITYTTVTGFIRSYLDDMKRVEAKAIIRHRQIEEEHRDRKAQQRLQAMIAQMKACGDFIPTWGPNFNFKKAQAHQVDIAAQRAAIYRDNL